MTDLADLTVPDTQALDGARRARSAEQKEARAQLILRAAEALYLERPHILPTAAEIAARAGVAKGTVYLYYATKEEVFLELLAWRLGLWAEALIRKIEEDNSPLSAQELAEAYVAYPASNPATLKLAGLASAVLEANVAREVVIRFKTGQLERLRALGAAAARRAPGLDGDLATQMFLRSYGYLLGIWQLSEAPAACRDAFSLPGLEALQMDFVHEATTGLRALWADLLD